MKFLIHETLRTLNTDDVFEFGLTEVSKSHEHPDLYEAVTVFIRNRKSQKHKTSGLSEFDVVRSFMTYVGINLRTIAKDDSIEFDLNGLTLDQYIPLTKSIREIMDE
ncbi:hypothetical protein [Mesorhizobium sp. CA7]|uniref:hypothetical protein n=1 Tax=Mesorhizobium sp. CA7 TaxID=588501 RepID=UPI001CD01961|nr:hypothetical protein [Mesorhizobium sp. CA7]MBZ9817434.1 hypothetical protein [Mesorhizobium sp. CA7]